MTAFDLDHFLALPRCADLAVSPDGRRLVSTVTTVAAEGTRMHTALWELDPEGVHEPRRLTWGPRGESAPAFGPDGSLYFLSARPDPDRPPETQQDPVGGIWRLPPDGGEAVLVAAPPAGADALAVARNTSTVTFAAGLHPGAATFEQDREHERARVEAGVTARLFTGYPIRYWDRDLGPRRRRLAVVPEADTGAARLPESPLTPDPGIALEEVGFTVTPDGATVVTGWRRDQSDPVRERVALVALPAGGGPVRPLRDDSAVYSGIAASPDGTHIACLREEPGSPDRAGTITLVLVDLATGEYTDLLPGFDRWPMTPVWAPDASAVHFLADTCGHTLPFRVDVAGGDVTCLAAEGAFSDLCPSPDGERVFALRASVAGPPVAVALDARRAEGPVTPLPTPGDDAEPPPPGQVSRLQGTAPDGTEVGAWLVTPPEATVAEPAPLVVFAHGGPYASWTGWHWRWNPHLLAARGYAVLLPDPAPSTGYGQAFVARGWGRWGEVTATDLEAALDAALDRPEIDPERVALGGGSFGGYLANWMAGHSDRFAAIVTHASLWSLRTFHGPTDVGVAWEREFGDPYTDPARYAAASPDAAVAAITAPLLITHGERDFRVPYSEALSLYTDLARHGKDAMFLSFPDEHHWVLKPQHARLWYETVLAFLDHHLLGAEWTRPELL